VFLYAADLNAFVAAAFAVEDSNSGLWGFQKLGEVFAQRSVRAVFESGCLQPDFECSIHHAGDFVAARAGLDSNVEDDGAVA